MSNNIKLKKGLKIVAIVLAIIISVTCGYFIRFFSEGKTTRKLSEILRLIQNNSVYYDDSLDSSDISALTVDAILKTDKYAKYYTEAEYKQYNSESAGNFSGFGIQVYIGTTTVYGTVGNSPAEKAGLKAHDIILGIYLNGQYYEVANLNEFTEKLGLVGDSPFTIKVKRDSQDLDFSLKSEDFEASYISYYDNQTGVKFWSEQGSRKLNANYLADLKKSELNDKTAIIEFTEFEGKAGEQLQNALSVMKSRNKTNLILDLRNNGGGQMTVLLDVLENLLSPSTKSGSVMAIAKGKKSNHEYSINENGKNDFIESIVILANENTASASECLIGALTYYAPSGFSKDKLVITYNTKREDYSTFGKGIMQTTYDLLNGGGLKITTAKIYWPDGETCIQDVGITCNPLNNCLNDELALLRAMELCN